MKDTLKKTTALAKKAVNKAAALIAKYPKATLALLALLAVAALV